MTVPTYGAILLDPSLQFVSFVFRLNVCRTLLKPLRFLYVVLKGYDCTMIRHVYLMCSQKLRSSQLSVLQDTIFLTSK